MKLVDKINEDLKSSMKSGDKFRLSVIRMLKSSILNEKTKMDKDKELSDDDVIMIIKKNVKQRESSIEEYTKYGRMDSVEDLKKEIEILKEYLPKELSEEEIDKEIDDAIKDVNASSIKDMGKVMKELNAKIGTRADMSKVSGKVKAKLS